MKVKDLKEELSRMNDDDDFEFRLFSESGYWGNKFKRLQIMSYGTQMTKPPTSYINLGVEESDVTNVIDFPNVFYIDGHLTTITRLKFVDGQVTYKERCIDGIYKNEGEFY